MDSRPFIVSEPDFDIYDSGFSIPEKVTKVTIDTLLNNRLGLAGSIAYVDNGAELYEKFKRSHLTDANPAQSTTAKLISTHKSTLVNEIRDIERLIIVGGGSYGSINAQEMALLSGLFAHQRKPKIREIVLIDVSKDFLLEGGRAIADFQAKHNKPLKVIPIRADFKDISGDRFDAILEAYGVNDRESTKAAALMTGATFGNIESISTQDKFPGNEVDVQMAHLGELVGTGSTVMFDHFTKIDTSENYYNTPELSAFFNNVPALMQRYCKGLQDFNVNGDNGQEYFRYRARPLYNSRMIAHELVAQIPQMPKVVNGSVRVFPIGMGDTLSLMFSLQTPAQDIASRPEQNTGLESQYNVAHKDLQVMHVFKKVGSPGALYHPDTIHHSIEPRAFNFGASVASKAMQGLSRMVPLQFRPMNLGLAA